MTEQGNNKIVLVESQYFPSISCYKTSIEAKILEIERYEHYQKVSFRNRCYIAGPNGMILLSVPLTKGKNQRTIMKDVRISDAEKWQSLHWKTLTSAYRRSPWFEYFEEELAGLYERPFQFLIDWNMACLEFVNGALGVSPEIRMTEAFRKSYADMPEVTDLRDHWTPGAEPPADAPVYTQVFGERTGFLPNLSILDLLCCEGKRATELLK
ncbi:WbqC family protein [Chitinophaga lutea]